MPTYIKILRYIFYSLQGSKQLRPWKYSCWRQQNTWTIAESTSNTFTFPPTYQFMMSTLNHTTEKYFGNSSFPFSVFSHAIWTIALKQRKREVKSSTTPIGGNWQSCYAKMRIFCSKSLSLSSEANQDFVQFQTHEQRK